MKPCHTNRPILRPVLVFWPWWQVDVQLLPPYSWCPGCGAEVYDPAEIYCPGCRPAATERRAYG
jgi:hypothetical protein